MSTFYDEIGGIDTIRRIVTVIPAVVVLAAQGVPLQVLAVLVVLVVPGDRYPCPHYIPLRQPVKSR